MWGMRGRKRGAETSGAPISRSLENLPQIASRVKKKLSIQGNYIHNPRILRHLFSLPDPPPNPPPDPRNRPMRQSGRKGPRSEALPHRHARTCSTTVRFNSGGPGERLERKRVSGGLRRPGHEIRHAGLSPVAVPCVPAFPHAVMAGLVPAIHVLWHRGAGRERARRRKHVDGRNKSGHDDRWRRCLRTPTPPTLSPPVGTETPNG